MVKQKEKRSPFFSILIPCYNEEAVIAQTVRDIMAVFDSVPDIEILCVNNCSTDSTERELVTLVKEHDRVVYSNTPKAQGYGVAVRWGLTQFRGEYVVIAMADGSEDPKDILKMYSEAKAGAQCVFGDRFARGAKVKGYPKFKLMFNRLGNLLLSLLLFKRYSDFTNGFKCYHRSVIDDIQPLVSSNFNLTIEMSIGAVLSGAKYVVVPNNWEEREQGVSKFKLFKESSLYLSTIAYCFFKNRVRGKRYMFLEANKYTEPAKLPDS